jgi:hypothetical protein
MLSRRAKIFNPQIKSPGFAAVNTKIFSRPNVNAVTIYHGIKSNKEVVRPGKAAIPLPLQKAIFNHPAGEVMSRRQKIIFKFRRKQAGKGSI